MIIYSTYLGGSEDDRAYDIAVDSFENAYVTGYTASPNFPIQNPYDSSLNGNVDVFVTKFSCIGSTLIYSTYLGGNSNEHGYGITVDNDGNAYITGGTSSSDFPTRNPFQSSFGGLPGWHTDAFVTDFSNNGELLYSTFLGGSDLDYGQGIAVDDSGQFYVAGYTYSSDFPTQNPYQHSFGGGDTDAFISKFSANGSALVYSTYLGGNDNDRGYGIAINSSGNAYVTGWTCSSNFPIYSGYDGVLGGTQDAFVTKFISNGDALSYSTYLGGSSSDNGMVVVVDYSNKVYVTGGTSSS